MKKIYKKPFAEVVNIKLLGSVMDDEPNTGVGGYSNTTWEGDAKENNLLFDDDSWDNDLWGDSGNSADSYDIWKE